MPVQTMLRPGSSLPPRAPGASSRAAGLQIATTAGGSLLATRQNRPSSAGSSRNPDEVLESMLSEVTFAAESSDEDMPGATRASSIGIASSRSTATTSVPSSRRASHAEQPLAPGVLTAPVLAPGARTPTVRPSSATSHPVGVSPASTGRSGGFMLDAEDDAVRNFGLPTAVVATTGGARRSSAALPVLPISDAVEVAMPSSLVGAVEEPETTSARGASGTATTQPVLSDISVNVSGKEGYARRTSQAGTDRAMAAPAPAGGAAAMPQPSAESVPAPAPRADAALVAGAQADALRAFITRPGVKGDGLVRCYVVRDRGMLGFSSSTPTWRVFSESDERFLMLSKRRSGNRTSNYLITMDPSAPGTDGRAREKIAGKLRADWAGSQYILYDNGYAPGKVPEGQVVRSELLAAFFNYDAMGPGQVRVVIPRLHASGRTAAFPCTGKPEDSVVAASDASDTSRLMWLANKKPKLDPTSGRPVLNFGGRVKQASVKNFQIACEEVGDDVVVMQFGRILKDRFAFDVGYPLSLLQAFGILLAAMDPKIADTRGYESLRRQRRDAPPPPDHDSDAEDERAVASVFGQAAARRASAGPTTPPATPPRDFAAALTDSAALTASPARSRRASASSTSSVKYNA